ncbi:MAG: hypothetical protein EOP04_03660 [Proteobacteria bacterium]|nr:MAG: hypothetical protein EOP04_03660 [Pseudomonadota bacterium]
MNSKLYEPSLSLSDAMSKIDHLDSYFSACEQDGCGINSKESIWMIEAMVYVLKDGRSRLTSAEMIQEATSSKAARSCLGRAIDKAWPGMRELFAPA